MEAFAISRYRAIGFQSNRPGRYLRGYEKLLREAATSAADTRESKALRGVFDAKGLSLGRLF